MLSTEREAFEAELCVLLSAFDAPATDARKGAYWRALERMPLPVFKRTVDELIGERGDSKLPSSTRIWAASRDLRAKAPDAKPQHDPSRDFDDFHRLGQRCLLWFFARNGGPTDATLPKLLEIKDRIVDGVRASYGGNSKACDDAGETAEFRDMLLDAFAKVFEPRTWQEIERDREQFCNARNMPFTPRTPPTPRATAATSDLIPIGEAFTSSPAAAITDESPPQTR